MTQVYSTATFVVSVSLFSLNHTTMADLANLDTSLVNSLLSSGHRDVAQVRVKAIHAQLLREARRQAGAVIGKIAPDVCDAFRWLTGAGPVVDVSAIGLVILLDAVLITASCEFVPGDKHVTLGHVPISLAQSPALLAHLHQQSEPVQRLVGQWAEKKRSPPQRACKTVFAKIFGKSLVKLDALKDKLIDPLERVLPQELRGPWLTWFTKRPQAIRELVNNLPAERSSQAGYGIEPLEHAAISQYLLAWAADINASLDPTRIVAKSRKLKPDTGLEQAREIIKDWTIPVSSLKELQALCSGTFPSPGHSGHNVLGVGHPRPHPRSTSPEWATIGASPGPAAY